MLPRLLPLVLLATLPVALAHAPTATPKAWCESAADAREHDWRAGDADEGHVKASPPAGGALKAHPARGYVDGNQADCDNDLVPGDHDGHHELGVRGFSLLSVDTGDGVNGGALACWGETGHHAASFTITAEGGFPPLEPTWTPVGFVYADASRVPPPAGPDCGDGILESCDWLDPVFPAGNWPFPWQALFDEGNRLAWNAWQGACHPADRLLPLTAWDGLATGVTVPFGAGADGAYHVHMRMGGQGHVTSP